MALDTLEHQLIQHEGLTLKLYQDTVGKWTIGVGRNLSDIGISQEEAMVLLTNDINAARASVSRAFPWFPTLDAVRQRVLIDLSFNMGIGGLQGFVHMLSAVQRGDYDTAAEELLDSKWASQVGVRATTLAYMLRTGAVPA